MKENIMSPMSVANIQYEIDGHLYTTFVAPKLAGFPVNRALELSWGSQIPDANRKYTAVSAAWDALWNVKSKSLMKTLHSLHGGNEAAVYKRRRDLKLLIGDALDHDVPDWRIGLMVHAYGDSYAHTYEKRGKLYAYGYPLGHVIDGHDPDKIGLFPKKYLDYVTNLYQVLGGKEEPHKALERIYKIVDELEENPNTLNTQIRVYAVELGMGDEESGNMRDKLLNSISVSDVLETMKQMESFFSRPKQWLWEPKDNRSKS